MVIFLVEISSFSSCGSVMVALCGFWNHLFAHIFLGPNSLVKIWSTVFRIYIDVFIVNLCTGFQILWLSENPRSQTRPFAVRYSSSINRSKQFSKLPECSENPWQSPMTTMFRFWNFVKISNTLLRLSGWLVTLRAAICW